MRRAYTHLMNQDNRPENVIAYWQFNNGFKDFYNNYNLTDNGSQVSIQPTGIEGSYADNNGTDALSYLKTVPSPKELSFTDGVNDKPFSFAFWFKLDALALTFFVDKRTQADGEYQIAYASSNSTFAVSIFDKANTNNRINCDYFIPLNTSQWYHAVVTYDGSKLANGISLYIDGVSGGTKTETGTYTGMAARNENVKFLGGFSAFTMDGGMDEIVVFDKALTQQEVTDIYNKGLAGEPLYT